MSIVEWLLKFFFWSWMAIIGVGLADLAMDLQKTMIQAYQKGPISARTFTRMLTEDNKPERPIKK